MRLKWISFILCTFGAFAAPAAAPATLDLSSVKVQTLNKTPTTLKAEFSQGKILLLDLWASWCGPCQESLPFYESLLKKYEAQGLQVVAVSLDEDLKAANDFAEKNKLGLRLLWDSSKELAKKLEVKAVPTALIVDAEGKILHRKQGFLADSGEKLEQEIIKLLPKKPN